MKACIPLVLACALLTACDLTEPLDVPTPPPGPRTYVVSGTVLDNYDVPVQGATVQAWNGGLQKRSTYTDARGFFSIDGVSGEIQLSVQKFGNPSEILFLQVQSNLTLNVKLNSAMLEAGQSHQIWVSSYYAPQEFELKATF